MHPPLWLVPALPLAGFVLLALGGGRLHTRAIAWVGVGASALAAATALAVGLEFIRAGSVGYHERLGGWIAVAGFQAHFGLALDRLALTMLLTVAVVGFLIHLYAAEFMRGDEGYRRFFAWMNLFLAAMLTLVLADNLLLLYLGWEGVGLCSYLLIGFWYRDPANGAAARKAFIVTRIGDTALLVGLLLLASRLGTLEIAPLLAREAQLWTPGSALPTLAAALLLGGAVGKSAQLPLQIWLPDAMAGPTPVSALIHAATMVTAGVYLIARTGGLFALAPAVQTAVAVIGAATLLLAATSALAQRDIKRVLAWSTMSQIGYMFLALGVGAWPAALFHLVTHAAFKALLFMAAGVVIDALDHEHDLFRMGGLRRTLPAAFWGFLVGGASLAGLPLVTAGFYSKEGILAAAWALPGAGRWLWAAGWVGAVLTGLYISRALVLAFLGPSGRAVGKRPGAAMVVPMALLGAGSLALGWLPLPAYLGGGAATRALPAHAPPEAVAAAVLAPLIGIALAWLFYLRAPGLRERLLAGTQAAAATRLLAAGWGFDRAYGRLLVRPFLTLARRVRDDPLDRPYHALAGAARILHRTLSTTQNGAVRRYAAGIAAGAIILVAIGVLL